MTQFEKIGDGGRLTVNDLVVETAIAFGQGTNGFNVTPRANRVLRSLFKPRFKKHLPHYREHRLAIQSYAIGLGRYAWILAHSKGHSIVDLPELKTALDKFPCPIIPPVFQLLKELGEGFRN